MLNYVSGIGEQRSRVALRRGGASYSRFMKEFKPSDLLADDVNYGDDSETAYLGKSAKAKARKENRKESKAKKKDLKKQIKAAPKGQKKALRKELRKERGSLVAKVAAGPTRAAFLVLVKLNFLKLKDKLKQAKAKHPDKLYAFWSKFGGNKATLQNVINGYDEQNIGSLGVAALGVLPAAAAALATATPILIAVAKFLKESGIMSPKDKESGDMDIAIDQGKQNLLKDPDISKDFANEEVEQDEVKIVRQTGGADTDQGADPGADPGDEGGFLGLTKTQLMLGGGALLVGGYLLMKKK